MVLRLTFCASPHGIIPLTLSPLHRGVESSMVRRRIFHPHYQQKPAEKGQGLWHAWPCQMWMTFKRRCDKFLANLRGIWKCKSSASSRGNMVLPIFDNFLWCIKLAEQIGKKHCSKCWIRSGSLLELSAWQRIWDPNYDKVPKRYLKPTHITSL